MLNKTDFDLAGMSRREIKALIQYLHPELDKRSKRLLRKFNIHIPKRNMDIERNPLYKKDSLTG